MTTHRREAIVVGCGVIGLSAAIRLIEAGWSVRIWARDLPPETTSDVAAAFWYPYRAWPEDLVTAWAARSYAVYRDLSAEPEAGVRAMTCLELLHRPAPDPWWAGVVPGFGRASPADLPPGYPDGYVFPTWLVEMPRYLPYLLRRFERSGGTIERRNVRDLGEPLAEAPLVVNCSGLGARELAPDPAVFAIRGQIARAEPIPPGRILICEDEPGGLTYVVPRGDGCVLGGTAEEGQEDLDPDPVTAAAIVARCRAIEPALASRTVVGHRVGLRPGRATVRLEAVQPAPGRLILHNYGHGGAGVTLAWGCADTVLDLARAWSAHGDGDPVAAEPGR